MSQPLLPVLPDLVFEDLILLQAPVIIGQNKYWLRQGDGEAVARYKTVSSSGNTVKDGVISGVGSMVAEAEMLLVGDCLFRQKDDKPVPRSVYGKWPNTILKNLITAAKTLSGLDGKETKESLLKQKAKIEEKLSLFELGGPLSDPKALPSDTPIGSPSLTDSESSVSIVSSNELLIDSSSPGKSGSD